MEKMNVHLYAPTQTGALYKKGIDADADANANADVLVLVWYYVEVLLKY